MSYSLSKFYKKLFFDLTILSAILLFSTYLLLENLWFAFNEHAESVLQY